jgi:hypothetical protein
MADADVSKVLENVNWDSETLLADFSAEMEKVGTVLDYSSGEGFKLAYALARANGEMIISKEAWKETLSIVKSVQDAEAELSEEQYKHLTETYGTLMSDYFVKMADGTYKLTTAASDFEKAINKLEK